MRISIVFRPAPDYCAHADRVAAEIKRARGIDVEMMHATADVFDVRVDGDLIFSKSHTGRFPEAGELLRYVSVPTKPAPASR